jgi:uncharacterized protein
MFQLPEEDQRLLLGIARSAVQARLSRNTADLPEIPHGVAAEPHGVFVSIHREKELRGCIGNVVTDKPLYWTTARCAVSAATSDPRFPSVTRNELPYVSFELSVLSIPEPMQDIDEIEIGKHGLIVTQGSACGLLLPQVATQYHWNRNQFLAETSIKAGLLPNAWREGATIHCFTAAVFGEEHIHHPAGS